MDLSKLSILMREIPQALRNGIPGSRSAVNEDFAAGS